MPMAASSAEGLTMVRGPYFTKYREDYWNPVSSVSSVMFKDKEYPSASVALDAYIDQYEGRPCDVLGHRSSAEAVEDLLIPRTLDTTLDRYAGVGSMDKLHFQRLSSLKRMVDEAYERLEKQGNRALRDDRQLPDYHQHHLSNSVFADSQRLLDQVAIDRISPLPGSSSIITSQPSDTSIATDLLLNARPHVKPVEAVNRSTEVDRDTGYHKVSHAYRTMHDYVDSARKHGLQSSTELLLSKLKNTPSRETPHTLTPTDSQHLMIQPKVQLHLDARHSTIKGESSKGTLQNGGRAPPSWVDDISALDMTAGIFSHGSDPLAQTLRQSPRTKTKTVTYADHLHGGDGQGLNNKDFTLLTRDPLHLGRSENQYSSGLYDSNIYLGKSIKSNLLSSRQKDSMHHEFLEFTTEHKLVPVLARSDVSGGTMGLDRLSLTTDDLVYATPDGRNIQSQLNKSQSKSLPQLSATSNPFVEHENHQSNSLSSGTENILLHSPTGRKLNRHALIAPVGRSSKLDNTTSRTEGMQRRHEFVQTLLQEVDDSPSSIITGHLGDGALQHPYLSPMPNKVTSHDIPTHIKIKQLGLLTPETERLLSNPPMPAAMPGYVTTGSPVLPSSERTLNQTTDVDIGFAQAGDADFSERVRALLTTPIHQGDEYSITKESPATEEILSGDRDWEHTVSFKPSKYIHDANPSMCSRLDRPKEGQKANIVDSFLKECLDEADKVQQNIRVRRKNLVHEFIHECVHNTWETGTIDRSKWNDKGTTLTGRDQPGSMEALKNILFRVQSMVPPSGGNNGNDMIGGDHSGDNGQSSETSTDASQKVQSPIRTKPPQNQGPDIGSENRGGDSQYDHLISEGFDDLLGTESLQKAMNQLTKLKTLVQDSR